MSAFPPPAPFIPPAPPLPQGFGTPNIVALVGAGGLILGSFLPWATIDIFFGQLSIAGTLALACGSVRSRASPLSSER